MERKFTDKFEYSVSNYYFEARGDNRGNFKYPPKPVYYEDMVLLSEKINELIREVNYLKMKIENKKGDSK